MNLFFSTTHFGVNERNEWIFIKFSGVFYMQAQCKVQITQQNVWIEVRNGRDNLLVYIDDMEQDANQNSCKFQFL